MIDPNATKTMTFRIIATALKPLQGKIAALALVLLYLVLMCRMHGYLRPDQIFLVMALAAAALLGSRGGTRFVIDWMPFTLFIIIYDGMRGFADNFAGRINVGAPYLMEKTLFGWVGGGDVLPFALQLWRRKMEGQSITHFLDSASGFFYTLHFLAPFVFGWLLWHTWRDRRGFYAFAYTITILNILALATFFLYPAAPPWYVWKHHFAIPMTGMLGDPASLVKFDEFIRFPLFSSIYNALNPNAFAAIPSLHAAYPFLIAWFACSRSKNLIVRTFFFFYVASTWFAACYLNHHYIVDILIGAAYAVASVYIYRYLAGPFIIEPLVFRRGNENSSDTIAAMKQRSSIATAVFGFGGAVFILLLLAHARGYW